MESADMEKFMQMFQAMTGGMGIAGAKCPPDKKSKLMKKRKITTSLAAKLYEEGSELERSTATDGGELALVKYQKATSLLATLISDLFPYSDTDLAKYRKQAFDLHHAISSDAVEILYKLQRYREVIDFVAEARMLGCQFNMDTMFSVDLSNKHHRRTTWARCRALNELKRFDESIIEAQCICSGIHEKKCKAEDFGLSWPDLITWVHQLSDRVDAHCLKMSFKKLDLSTGSTRFHGRGRGTAVVWNDVVYAYGGRQGLTGRPQAFNEVYAYDLTTGIGKVIKTDTSSLSNKKNASFSHSSVLFNDVMYVYGGEDNDAGDDPDLFRALDLKTMKWQSQRQLAKNANAGPRATLHYGVECAGMCTMGHCIYVLGGRHNGPDGVMDTILWSYDTKKRQWSSITHSRQEPSAIANKYFDYHSLVPFPIYNCILLCGGQVSPNASGTLPRPNDVVYRFDFATKIWSIVDVQGYMPYMRNEVQLVSSGTSAYCYGGYGETAIGSRYFDDAWMMKLHKRGYVTFDKIVPTVKNSHPGLRGWPAAALDRKRNQIIIVGGYNSLGPDRDGKIVPATIDGRTNTMGMMDDMWAWKLTVGGEDSDDDDDADDANRNVGGDDEVKVGDSAVDNNSADSRDKDAAQKSKKLNLRTKMARHNMMWIPYRCNIDGCDVVENLSKCAGCGMVYYCSVGHQRQDWKHTHKKECKYFQAQDVWGRPYKRGESFERQPELTKESVAALLTLPIPANAKCVLCDRVNGDGGVALARTQCCGELMCDNEQDYPQGSYSKDFCIRSHRRYTRCGFHDYKEHYKKHSAAYDWRQCHVENCIWGESASIGLEMMKILPHMAPKEPLRLDPWYALNGYNIAPIPHDKIKKGRLLSLCPRCNEPIFTPRHGFILICGYGRVCADCQNSKYPE